MQPSVLDAPPPPIRDLGRRSVIVGAGAGLLSVAAGRPALGAPPRRFSAAWHAAPTLSVGLDGGASKPVPVAQTVRLIVHPLAAGASTRLRFSNLRGLAPLTLGPVWIGLRSDGAAVRRGSHRQVTFSGRSTVTIPVGEEVVSDVAHRSVEAFRDLAVSVYVPPGLPNLTGHQAAFQTSYLSTLGDHSGEESGEAFVGTTASWPFLCGIDVVSARPTIVALGDSITDCGVTTINRNQRWPDHLARRLARAGLSVGVANSGIAGNQILQDELVVPGAGASMLHRFQRDVVDVPGARDVIIHAGTNDIGLSAAGAEQVIAGLLRLARMARAAGIRPHATTILPAGRARLPGHGSPHAAGTRDVVNAWLRRHWRTSFASLTDLAVVMAEPGRPQDLASRFDCGDGLHPNDAGTAAMARAFDLRRLTSGR